MFEPIPPGSETFWSKHLDGILDGIAASIVFALMVTLWSFLGQAIRFRWGRLVHTAWRYLAFRREVLLWIDTDLGTAHRLADHVKSKLKAGTAKPLHRVHFRVVQAPVEILSYPASPKVMAAVVLINTDVSKLSADDKIRQRIEAHLLTYLRRGGGLVGGHDVIYRRARNEDLRGAFGGKIKGFSPLSEKPVGYVKNPVQAGHPISAQLPDSFGLDDGEILATEWPDDAAILFHSNAAEKHSLVVAKDYLEGRLVWLNSCDHQDPLCASIQVPEDDFVTLLAASVQWVAKC